MVERPSGGRVVPVHDLCDYFRSAVDAVVAEQSIALDVQTTHYVVNMITLFSRSENLFTDQDSARSMRPLALLLADACDAPSSEQRNHLLQRIGDVSLFFGGFFADGFARKAVDIDYYINMGENAYGSLSEEVRGTFRGNAYCAVYRELASKFRVLIDVLHEVRDNVAGKSCTDPIRTYEIWRKTGSRRAERLLRRQGIVPFGGSTHRQH